jgi:hypothetical protein
MSRYNKIEGRKALDIYLDELEDFLYSGGYDYDCDDDDYTYYSYYGYLDNFSYLPGSWSVSYLQKDRFGFRITNMELGKMVDMDSFLDRQHRRNRKIDRLLGLEKSKPTIGDFFNESRR